jgi:hypothetical protein
MKIMYVASNLSDAGDLVLEREITELQRRLIGVAGEAIELLTFPQLPIEQLPLELSKLKPDILHISSHGMDGSLALANEAGDLVKLTADAFGSRGSAARTRDWWTAACFCFAGTG